MSRSQAQPQPSAAALPLRRARPRRCGEHAPAATLGAVWPACAALHLTAAPDNARCERAWRCVCRGCVLPADRRCKFHATPRPAPATCRFLTDTGIEYLREFLNLPSEIVPATLKKSTRPLERDTRPPRRDGPPRRFGDREGYRSEKAGAPGEYRPEFRGGFGRGAAPQ